MTRPPQQCAGVHLDGRLAPTGDDAQPHAQPDAIESVGTNFGRMDYDWGSQSQHNYNDGQYCIGYVENP